MGDDRRAPAATVVGGPASPAISAGASGLETLTVTYPPRKLLAGGHVGDAVGDEELAAAVGQRQRAARHHAEAADVDDAQRVVARPSCRAIDPSRARPVMRRAAEVERLEHLAAGQVDADERTPAGDVGHPVVDLDGLGPHGQGDGLDQRRLRAGRRRRPGSGRRAAGHGRDVRGGVDGDVGAVARQGELAQDDRLVELRGVDDGQAVGAGRDVGGLPAWRR